MRQRRIPQLGLLSHTDENGADPVKQFLGFWDQARLYCSTTGGGSFARPYIRKSRLSCFINIPVLLLWYISQSQGRINRMENPKIASRYNSSALLKGPASSDRSPHCATPGVLPMICIDASISSLCGDRRSCCCNYLIPMHSVRH